MDKIYDWARATFHSDWLHEDTRWVEATSFGAWQLVSRVVRMAPLAGLLYFAPVAWALQLCVLPLLLCRNQCSRVVVLATEAIFIPLSTFGLCAIVAFAVKGSVDAQHIDPKVVVATVLFVAVASMSIVAPMRALFATIVRGRNGDPTPPKSVTSPPAEPNPDIDRLSFEPLVLA